MEISVPGFIHKYCTPNAILTLSEYLTDYASEEVKLKGWQVIDIKMNEITDSVLAHQLKEKIKGLLRVRGTCIFNNNILIKLKHSR